MPEHGEKVRVDGKKVWYVFLICQDCGVERIQLYKTVVPPERCAKCHRARYGNTLGPLTLPAHERIDRRRVR